MHPLPPSHHMLRLNSVARHIRPFSSSATKNMQFFLVQVPDKPGVLDKRMTLRPAHLEALENKTSGHNFIICGGGVAAKHPGEGETPQVTGSTLIVQTDDRECIVEKLKDDVYYKEGIWDLTGVKIEAVSPRDKRVNVTRETSWFISVTWLLDQELQILTGSYQ